MSDQWTHDTTNVAASDSPLRLPGRRLGPLHDYYTRRLALWGY